MNYLDHYILLIDSRSSRSLRREKGYEIHHIIPKCLHGEDEPFNLVKLTYKEHLLAHHLLVKIYPDNDKIKYAYRMMLIQHGDKEIHRQRMLTINPMFSEQSRRKMSNTRKRKIASGEISLRKLEQAERNAISKRMKENNPMVKEPWKNHTARPVRVFYLNGDIEEFKYMKEITLKKGIPYGTLKYMSQRNTGSKKHGILKIEKIYE
jgi:hypothetical protein